MKKLPIGIQTFSEIRENDYVYVDKTAIAKQMIDEYKFVFVSRPRRFGKSLFLDTLQNIFEGNQALFIGLAIEKQYDWSQQFPVIRIGLSGDFKTLESSQDVIQDILDFNQKNLGVSGCEHKTLSVYFRRLITAAYEKYQQPVVILIDEYDKPILDNIDNTDLALRLRDLLQGFYVVMKEYGEYLRFVFLTGVSKFSKVSIFSGLNNLMDLSLHADYATVCGYTQTDLETVFVEHLQGVDWDMLQEWYNGYQFNGEPVYNPFDILKFIAYGKIYSNYWFETGTPTFLVKLMKKQTYYLPNLNNLQVGSDLVNTFDIESISIESLLFQAGYMTLDKIEQSPRGGVTYHLRVPNKEVQVSMSENLIHSVTDSTSAEQEKNSDALYTALQNADMNEVQRIMTQIFAGIPYHLYSNAPLAQYEGYYCVVIYSYLLSLGVNVQLESSTNKGILDMVVDIADKRYLIEFKVAGRGDALKQIKEKQYFQAFYETTKQVYLLGIHFDDTERNLSVFDWEKAG